MSDGPETSANEAGRLPSLEPEVPEKKDLPGQPLDPVRNFLRRRAEVTQQDHAEFSNYLQHKSARHRQQTAPLADALRPATINRRSMLKWAAGTAAAGEAAVLGYTMVTGQDISFHGLMPSGVASAEPQRQSIRRELVNPQADIRGRTFGNWVLLMPTKLGGGTYAVNLQTGRTLAWISYWNYAGRQ